MRPWVLLPILVACGRINFVPGGDDGQGGDGGTRGDGRGGPDGMINVGANIIFVTAADIVPGALGGIENADARCRADAAAAGLPGQCVAWMSLARMRPTSPPSRGSAPLV